MNKKLIRILLTALLLLVAWLVERNASLPLWQLLLVYLVPYLLIGHDVMAEAAEGIAGGEPFDENFLMCVATGGALLIGFLPGAEHQFMEAVFVMLFFQVGELFEDYAEERSRESISKLMDIRPDIAHVRRGGEWTDERPEQVAIGDTLLIKPGEKIPLDGTVVSGSSSLNTVALTGESTPRDVASGDALISGCVNLSAPLQMRTTKTFGASTASKIIDLVENAGRNKSRSETFIKRFARIYTPVVVVAAIALAVVPPFFSGSYALSFPVWLYRALTFLVVSCPCALVISIPLTFFAGIGGASRKGILIKGGNYMDALFKVSTVVFDKTGTLTRGVFAVDVIHPEHIGERELLHLAAHVERHSTHPIALSLRQAYPYEADDCTVDDIAEVAGQGIRARVNGRQVCVGNEKMMQSLALTPPRCPHVGTVLHVAIDNQYAGHIVISDQLKPDAAQAVAELKRLGAAKTVMLTGDRREVGQQVARQVGLDEFKTDLLPADKVSEMERLLRQNTPGQALAFVGDGINDAPVLARADVGIAMGGLGSDAAIEAADVVLMNDKPSDIATSIRIARRTIAIARQNAVFSIGVKALVLLLAALGLAGMGLAVFADVGVMVLAVMNAMRALYAK